MGAPVRRLGVAGAALLAATLAGTVNAHADVLSIGDGGAVTMQRGAAVYLSADMTAQPILAAPTARPIHRHGGFRAPPATVKANLDEAAQVSALSPALLEAVAWRESAFNDQARSAKGAVGLMQITAGAAHDFGINRQDPRSNATGGGRYLNWLLQRYHGDLVKALAAYNAGPGAVDRYGGVPPFPETRAYVDAILDHMARAVAPSLPSNKVASR